MFHHLKIYPDFFESIIDGSKTFEIRKNDRDYHVGDYLYLNEYFPKKGYSYRFIKVLVTYVFSDSLYVKDGFVILGIRRVKQD